VPNLQTMVGTARYARVTSSARARLLETGTTATASCPTRPSGPPVARRAWPAPARRGQRVLAAHTGLACSSRRRLARHRCLTLPLVRLDPRDLLVSRLRKTAARASTTPLPGGRREKESFCRGSHNLLSRAAARESVSPRSRRSARQGWRLPSQIFGEQPTRGPSRPRRPISVRTTRASPIPRAPHVGVSPSTTSCGGTAPSPSNVPRAFPSETSHLDGDRIRRALRSSTCSTTCRLRRVHGSVRPTTTTRTRATLPHLPLISRARSAAAARTTPSTIPAHALAPRATPPRTP